VATVAREGDVSDESYPVRNFNRDDRRKDCASERGDGFDQATILRASYGSSGLNPCEQQSRHHEKSHYGDGGVRRRGEEDSERGQNEQGSSCLDGPPRNFVRQSFTAEPLWCSGIVSMAVGPTHEIVQGIKASSGGAIASANLGGCFTKRGLPDETFLLRVGSRYVKRHSFTPLKDSTG
jgi:hypothetical protein